MLHLFSLTDSHADVCTQRTFLSPLEQAHRVHHGGMKELFVGPLWRFD